MVATVPTTTGKIHALLTKQIIETQLKIKIVTLRADFVQVSEARSDWAPDPANPLPTFNPPRRVPHGITILGRLFDDGLLGQVGVALERALGVVGERPTGFA